MNQKISLPEFQMVSNLKRDFRFALKNKAIIHNEIDKLANGGDGFIRENLIQLKYNYPEILSIMILSHIPTFLINEAVSRAKISIKEVNELKALSKKYNANKPIVLESKKIFPVLYNSFLVSPPGRENESKKKIQDTSSIIIRLLDQRLSIRFPPGNIDESRTFSNEDYERVDNWIYQYRHIISSTKSTEELLRLGRDIYDWMDGVDGWIERFIEKAAPPLVMEFTVDASPSKKELLFLETPWELMAKGDRHLAADPNLAFCPVRRIGRAGKPRAPSEYRLSTMFMAAEPRGQEAPLRYEEEASAILDAAGNIGMDLVVEESGNLELLAKGMAREWPVDILHFSCHGVVSPEPTLYLEDEVGNRADATPWDLFKALGRNIPGLMILSAGFTSEPGRRLNSFSSRLIRFGASAVLGWSGSVKDWEATRFTSLLFGYLSRKNSIEYAVAMARQKLMEPDETNPGPGPSIAWCMARIYLGEHGGGALTAGRMARRPGNREHGYKEFFHSKDNSAPVAGRDEFVGRRRQIQEIFRVFRKKEKAGVLIHGFGGQGKSSLASRIAYRMPDHKTVVICKDYDAPSILRALESFLPTTGVKEVVRNNLASVEDDPAYLKKALQSLLEGPCRDIGASRKRKGDITRRPREHMGFEEPLDDKRAAPDSRPVLLVIDDFEKILQPPAAKGLHTVNTRHSETIRALIAAFDSAKTESRLLITSRYSFTIPSGRAGDLAEKLHDLPLPPMETYESRKQAAARLKGLRPSGHPSFPGEVDPDRIERCIRTARGNPGLQERLFSISLDSGEDCDQALEAIEAFIQNSRAPDDKKYLKFLNDIAMDHLIDPLTKSEKEVLRLSTLFQVPAPMEILEKLAAEFGLEDEDPFGKRLFALGLWEAFEDPSAQGGQAVAVNALIRPKIGALSEDEAVFGVKGIIKPLFDVWGGAENNGGPRVEDLELTRLGLMAKETDVLIVSTENALYWLKELFLYTKAATLAKDSISILDEANVRPPANLLRVACELCNRMGDAENARSFIARAIETYDSAIEKKEPIQTKNYAHALLIQARLLAEEGDIDQAVASMENSKNLFEEMGNRRSRAVVLGDIAKILSTKGKVDEALTLYKESLQVFEEMGDRRRRAGILGDIARILVFKGEVDEALLLHEETLRVFKELGEHRSRASTLGDIGKIISSKGKMDEALTLYKKSLQVFEELGDHRLRAATLGCIARILASKGDMEEALALYEEILRVFEELGDIQSRAFILGDIALIRVSKGEVDEALTLFEEKLQVFEKLGNIRERAVTLRDIARIRVDNGELEEALTLHEETLRVFEDLGDIRERAVTLGDIARIRFARGELEKALSLNEEILRAFEELGAIRSRAVILGDIAQIRFVKGELEEALLLQEKILRIFEELEDPIGKAKTLWSIGNIESEKKLFQEALEHLMESYEINLKLGRLDGICMVGMDLGFLLCRTGNAEKGIPILERSLKGFIKLGKHQMVEQLQEIIQHFSGEKKAH